MDAVRIDVLLRRSAVAPVRIVRMRVELMAALNSQRSRLRLGEVYPVARQVCTLQLLWQLVHFVNLRPTGGGKKGGRHTLVHCLLYRVIVDLHRDLLLEDLVVRLL